MSPARHRVRPAPDLAKALAEADYLSLHMPGSASGPLIGERELGLMKPSAILEEWRRAAARR